MNGLLLAAFLSFLFGSCVGRNGSLESTLLLAPDSPLPAAMGVASTVAERGVVVSVSLFSGTHDDGAAAWRPIVVCVRKDAFPRQVVWHRAGRQRWHPETLASERHRGATMPDYPRKMITEIDGVEEIWQTDEFGGPLRVAPHS